MDESIRDRSCLDVGRILICTRYPEIINRSVKVKINDALFTIRMMEDCVSATFQKNE